MVFRINRDMDDSQHGVEQSTDDRHSLNSHGSSSIGTGDNDKVRGPTSDPFALWGVWLLLFTLRTVYPITAPDARARPKLSIGGRMSHLTRWDWSTQERGNDNFISRVSFFSLIRSFPPTDGISFKTSIIGFAASVCFFLPSRCISISPMGRAVVTAIDEPTAVYRLLPLPFWEIRYVQCCIPPHHDYQRTNLVK